jgi:hypothetical protein
MTVEARPARGIVAGNWLALAMVAFIAVVAVNAVDLSDGAYNWWGNFILLPGAAIVVSAIPLMGGGPGRTAGGYTLLCLGGLTFAVGAILMAGDMRRLWPLMIILPCVAIVGTVRWLPADPIGRATHRALVSVAGLGVVLGLTFLVLLGTAVHLGDRWWAYFMIAAGAVTAGNGFALLGDRRGYRLPGTVLLAGLGIGAILAGLRELLWR